jgi:hypothetical protein
MATAATAIHGNHLLRLSFTLGSSGFVVRRQWLSRDRKA